MRNSRPGRPRLVAFAAAFVLFLCLAPVFAAEAPTEPLTIETSGGVRTFSVEIADDPAERAQGLMFRTELPEGRGMLFDFRRPQEVSFWMKNTPLPLDMIFIGADGRVVGVHAFAVPQSTTPIPSGSPVLGVLEVAGGTAGKLGIAVGDRVRHRIFPD